MKTFDFMGKRKLALVLSAVLLVLSIGSLAVNGLQFGLDFTGGTLIEVKYENAVELSNVRLALTGAGYQDAVVQHFGANTDVIVRLANEHTATLGDEVLSALRGSADSSVQLQRSEFVGSQVGGELRDQGGLGMLLALFMMLVYVMFRFQSKFAIGALAALVHDVIIVLGIFSLLKLNFDLTVLAALLAVIGYSLNDTIVVSDRIRENFRKMRKGTSEDIINESLTQTLGRTVVTSLTTILVLFALFYFGGELIHGFSQALLVGVVVGTYSSLYVVTNVLLAMGISKEDLMVPEKEGADIDDMP